MTTSRDIISHGHGGESGTGGARPVEQQIQKASNEPELLAENLMEKICERTNLNQAYERVKSNKGAGGIDGITVDDLLQHLRQHKQEILQSLLDGSYQPKAVRGVQIPKAGGGIRQLGVPTVVDRVVQQAILQVMEPLYDPGFSESSYGFRPRRSAHGALKQAGKYVAEGYCFVVDIDLEKFFDRVNHDILMSRLARRLGDKRLLKIIRRFLTAGLMQNGVYTKREAGTVQGGPLSPLLSNILLDELDKELERRGHKFCRYADDCNIYVRSQLAGERVMASVKQFLEKRLKLKINEEKSAVALVRERKFLGYTLRMDGQLRLAPQTLQRIKDKIRVQTSRNRGVKLESMIEGLNQYLRGWLGYFYLAASRSVFRDLDSWIRRRLRCYRLKQRKRSWPIAKYLISLGVKAKDAWNLAKSSKGWWRLSLNPTIHRALSNAWFEEQDLFSLEKRHKELNTC